MQGIGPGGPGQHISGAITGQAVGNRRPRQVFDPGQYVASSIAAAAGARSQADCHTDERSGVIGGIGTAAAIQRVYSGPAGQQIVAAAAIKRIVATVAGQRVTRTRADQIFDPAQGITVGVTATASGTGKADRNPGTGGAVIGGINAAATVQHVRPRPAHQCIGAKATKQRVGA